MHGETYVSCTLQRSNPKQQILYGPAQQVQIAVDHERMATSELYISCKLIYCAGKEIHHLGRLAALPGKT